MSELLIIFIIVIVIALPLGILNAKHQEKQKNSVLDEVKRTKLADLRKELFDTMDAYNQRVQQWREYHQKYEHLGEPTTTIGYTCLEGYEPWKQPTVSLKIDESDPSLDTQIEWTMNCLAVYPHRYHVPEIMQTASFYKDARLAIIGNYEFKPEQLRFIKSRADREQGVINVIITTTILECPTLTLEYPIDRRDLVDDLKAAVNAFKELCQ